MKKDVLIFLDHVLESIDLIDKYTEQANEESFLSSPQFFSELARK